MKYNGKYSLKAQLLKEIDERDLMYHDEDGNLRDEFMSTIDDETKEKVKAQSKEVHTKRSVEDQEKYRTKHMSDYEKKWADLGPKQAEVNTTKKVETYRDLKTVLLGLTLTEREVEKAYQEMMNQGLKGVFWRAGFMRCKFCLSKVTGLETLTQTMGLVKDIGEEALAVMDLTKLEKMPQKKVRSNPLSDALTLHPDYSAIIDPDLEQDIFRELLEVLDIMEEAGDLDDKIPKHEQSFTEYTESYLEDHVGAKSTGIHGAEEAGGTGKLTDITVPKMTEKQYEVFTDWVHAAGMVLYDYGAEIA